MGGRFGKMALGKNKETGVRENRKGSVALPELPYYNISRKSLLL